METLIYHRRGTPQPEEPQIEVGQYLTFQLAQETFAIGILNIKEIVEYSTLTEVPMMPAFIRGVMNLRGTVVPVIDLALRFGREQTMVQRRTCIVLIEVNVGLNLQLIGIMVDAVHQVLDIVLDEIEPAPQFGSHIRADFIEGLAKINNQFVVLLQVDHVLSVDEMSLLSTLEAPPEDTDKNLQA